MDLDPRISKWPLDLVRKKVENLRFWRAGFSFELKFSVVDLDPRISKWPLDLVRKKVEN